VVESEDWLDIVSEELIDEIAVEPESSGVDLSSSSRIDTRPAHRESIGSQSHLRHQGNVFLVTGIVIYSHIAV
jgi:hypothetical protein